MTLDRYFTSLSPIIHDHSTQPMVRVGGHTEEARVEGADSRRPVRSRRDGDDKGRGYLVLGRDYLGAVLDVVDGRQL